MFPGTQSLLGKNVSELVGDDLKVYTDGSVEGTLNSVTGYTEFSGTVEEQSGHYFPFKLMQTGEKMTLKKNGVAGEGKENMNFDPDIVFRVTDKEDVFSVEVDGRPVVNLNFEKATLA